MSETSGPVFWMNNATPEMQEAIQQAQKNFKFFWRELSWERRRIIPGLDFACIKAPFFDIGQEDVEQMWVDDLMFDGETIYGTLLNTPDRLKSVKQGDAVEVLVKGISDWMYAVEGRAFGGYTVNVIRASMSPEEREAHDEAWGQDFGDPNDVKVMPDGWLPEGEDILTAEHPMSENMGNSLGEFLEEDPTAALATDEFGLNMVHSLALAGSRAGIAEMLKYNVDTTKKTSLGHTALDLAKMMDWPRVVELLT